MFIGRFWPIVAALAIAGSLAAKKRVPVTEGTMPTHGPLFVALLIGSILLIGVLTYVPALALDLSRAFHARDFQIASICHVTKATTAVRPHAYRPCATGIVQEARSTHPVAQPRDVRGVHRTIVTAILYVQAIAGHGEAPSGFILAITVWLLFTLLFANFAEALAEGRSRAQASSLRNMRQP